MTAIRSRTGPRRVSAASAARAILLFTMVFMMILPALSSAQTYRAADGLYPERLTVTAGVFREPVPPTDLDTVWNRLGDAAELPVEYEVLALARYFASGMVYGFSFVYVPADSARGVAERFELDPQHEIAWGDPAFSVVEEVGSESESAYVFAYRLSADQSAYRRRWFGMDVADSRGIGEASFLDDVAGQYAAVLDAVREAVRGHLRGIVRDKPAQVSGALVFTESPRIWTGSGNYHAEVRIRLRVDRIREYRVF